MKVVLLEISFDEPHSSDIQVDPLEDEGGVIRSIIDELHSWDINEIKWKVKLVLLKVSLMNLILPTSKKIKWKVNVVLLEE